MRFSGPKVGCREPVGCASSRQDHGVENPSREAVLAADLAMYIGIPVVPGAKKHQQV